MKEKVRHLYITRKLNRMISIGGTDFYISDLDIIFVDELKKRLKKDIEMREVDAGLRLQNMLKRLSMLSMNSWLYNQPKRLLKDPLGNMTRIPRPQINWMNS